MSSQKLSYHAIARIFALLSLNLLSSCQFLQRHPESGYSDSASSSRSGWQRLQSQTKVLGGSSLDATLDSLDEKSRLKVLENSLSTRKEMEQYTKILPFLKDDKEKIAFLEAGSIGARQSWIQESEIFQRAQANFATFEKLAETQDIALGMTEKLVLRAWGEPTTVESSGQAKFKNQRWKYERQIASTDGFLAEKKIVYFEGGRVIGWEKE